jgi:DNA polymerase III subunit epsilon
MAAAEDIPPTLVFVDLETTGGNAAYDRITEVAVIRLEQGELVEEWSSLVNPERAIPAYIEAFTGISDSMVADAPRFAEIAATVRQKLNGAVFVAHNARFDYSFLRSEFLRADMHFSAKVLCTVKLSRRLFPQFVRHNLDAVMERNGLVCSARHRAMGDARVLYDFWSKLRREIADPQLAAVVQTVLGAHALPAHLPAGLADDLPEGPGAYRFFGEDESLLYVGRSNSLRAGVCGHFAERAQSRFGDKVRRVDWVETAGELGAMLQEAEWLRARQPLYNRRTKSKSQPYTLRATDLADARWTAMGETPAERTPAGTRRPVQAVPIHDVDPAQLTQCFGVFHSEKDAAKALGDIARARQLCLKILGLEDGEGSCLAYQLGKCKGACVGKEPLILHNTRLQLALSSLKLKRWPFPGRIALREGDSRSDAPGFVRSADIHVVEHWSYLGTARSDEELAALSLKEAAVAFDADVYRILLRYFANHPKLNWNRLGEQPART